MIVYLIQTGINRMDLLKDMYLYRKSSIRNLKFTIQIKGIPEIFPMRVPKFPDPTPLPQSEDLSTGTLFRSKTLAFISGNSER